MPWLPAPTPTGLAADHLRGLSEDLQAALAGWHAAKAGDNAGARWWPWAIRAMPLDARIVLATDSRDDQAWEARERHYVQLDPIYFVNGYGHVQPPTGDPLPFRMWPEQHEVMDAFLTQLRVIVLKARQLGLTWLALHYAVWLMAFNEATPHARVLAMSKREEDAKKLLARARRIVRMLPAFLRPDEDPRTSAPSESTRELVLTGRGSMQSLVSTPEAARMETVTLFLWDEAAFSRNRTASRIWTSAQPTLGGEGQAFVISTGNGPAEAPGDGQAFAQLWQRARAGEVAEGEREPLHPIFLPDSTDPRRTTLQRDADRRTYLSGEDYEQEHPETEEQALQGYAGTKAFLLSGINAAERAGRELDEQLAAGTIAPPQGDHVRTGSDYGTQTHHVIVWPLEGGGVYLVDEVVGGGAQGMTVRDGALEVCRRLDACQWIEPDGARWPLCEEGCYDAAGVESNGTFRETVQAAVPLGDGVTTLDVWASTMTGAGRKVRTLGVPFGKFKVDLVDYARALFQRTARGEPVMRIAISPRCRVLLRQLRTLEVVEDGSGRIRKGEDHGPDAMLAGLFRTWQEYHAAVLQAESEPVPA